VGGGSLLRNWEKETLGLNSPDAVDCSQRSVLQFSTVHNCTWYRIVCYMRRTALQLGLSTACGNSVAGAAESGDSRPAGLGDGVDLEFELPSPLVVKRTTYVRGPGLLWPCI
jgi:hypothetical protein